jgi:hypothetical protein
MQVDPKGKSSNKRKADDLTPSSDTTTTTSATTKADDSGSQPTVATKKAKVEPSSSSSSSSGGGSSAAADTYIQAKSVWSGVAEQDGFDPCPVMYSSLLPRLNTSLSLSLFTYSLSFLVARYFSLRFVFVFPFSHCFLVAARAG